MYAELAVLACLVILCAFDVRRRSVPLAAFGIAAAVLVPLAVVVPQYDGAHARPWAPDPAMLAAAAAFCIVGVAGRLFAAGDAVAIMIASVATPAIGGLPTGIVLFFGVVILQGVVGTATNLAYNMADSYRHIRPFGDVRNAGSAARRIYWSMLARRKRDTDEHVRSVQRSDGSGGLYLSTRAADGLAEDTVYVTSAHPGMVYITASYAAVLLVFLAEVSMP